MRKYECDLMERVVLGVKVGEEMGFKETGESLEVERE